MGGSRISYDWLRGLVALMAVAYIGLTLQALTCVMALPTQPANADSAVPQPLMAASAHTAPSMPDGHCAADMGPHHDHTGHLSLCSCLDKLISATPTLVAEGDGHLPVVVATLSRPDGIDLATLITPSGGSRAPPTASLS